MTTTLLNALNLNSTPPPKFVLLEEEGNAEGSIIISTLIGQRLVAQPNPGLVVVCADMQFEHYEIVGLRWAHKLRPARESGVVRVIDSLLTVFHDYFDESPRRDSYLDRLWADIEAGVEEHRQRGRETISIIIDDLIFYKALFGADLAWLVDFCSRLNDLTTRYENVFAVVKITQKEQNELLCRHVEDWSNPILLIQPFETGSFKEVHGKLLLREKTDVDQLVAKETEKTLLFRIGARDIRVFAPGAVDLG